MMSKMRELSKIFIVIVALSFIALMVFEWGMDYTGRGQRQNIIGSVNGKELTYEMYSEMFQNLYQTEKSRANQDLDESQIANLRTLVWDRFVQQVLLEEEMKRLNITVSDSEIVYQIRHYPLQEIRNNPGFQTDGQFDWDKYYSSFSNPDIPWYQVEEYYRQQVLPFQKLQDIISSTARVSETEILEEFQSTAQKVRVSFLEIPFAKFIKQDLVIPEKESLDYYDEHLSEFQQNESRQLSYITFSLTPTAKDTQRISLEFQEIRNRLRAGENFNDLADIFSEDPAVKTNHGQYDYFERGAMVKPFEEAAFSGKIGELVGPVSTQFGQHIILVEDRRIKDGKEQAKVSHILLKISAGPSTREQQESNAAFFAEDAQTEGFDKMVEQEKLELKTTNFITEDNQFIPGFGRNFQIYDFAFKNKIGAISGVIESDLGFHIFKLTEIKKAGPRPFEEVKSVIETRLKTEKRKVEARQYAAPIQAEINQSLSLTQVFNNHAQDGIMNYDSTAEFNLKQTVPGIGVSNQFNATAFSLKEAEISAQVETNRAIYWMNLLEKTEFDSTQYAIQKEMLRQRLLSAKRTQVFMDWYEYLKGKADIEDNRKLFNL